MSVAPRTTRRLYGPRPSLGRRLGAGSGALIWSPRLPRTFPHQERAARRATAIHRQKHRFHRQAVANELHRLFLPCAGARRDVNTHQTGDIACACTSSGRRRREVAAVGFAPVLVASCAKPSAPTIRAENARFEFLTPSLVRMEYSPSATFVDSPTAVVQKRDWPAVQVHSMRKGGWLIATTSGMTLRYRMRSGPFTATKPRGNLERPHQRYTQLAPR